MSEFKCGKCGIEYEFDEYMKLPKIQAVESDDNPKEQHGYTSVCRKCGYIFHRDKFRLRESIEIIHDGKKGIIDVSTVFLELSHQGYYYETMMFNGDNSEIDFELQQERYKTKEEAIKGHKKLLKKLKSNKFKIKPISYSLEVDR